MKKCFKLTSGLLKKNGFLAPPPRGKGGPRPGTAWLAGGATGPAQNPMQNWTGEELYERVNGYRRWVYTKVHREEDVNTTFLMLSD